MRAALEPWRHLGRRGAYLVVKGLAWAIYGLGLILYTDGIPGVPLLEDPAVLEVLGGAWIIAGATAAATAPRLQDIGFLALSVLPGIWAVLYAWSWALWLLPGGPPGNPRGWVGALIFGVFTGVAWIVAGMVDVDEIPHNGDTAQADG